MSRTGIQDTSTSDRLACHAEVVVLITVQAAAHLQRLGLAPRLESAIHWCVKAAQKQPAQAAQAVA